MTNLAKRRRVLFVEPALFDPFRYLRSAFSISEKTPFLRKAGDNLWLLRLSVPLPFQERTQRVGIGAVKWVNDRACFYLINKTLQFLGFKPSLLLWAYYTPRTAFFLNKIRSKFVVCDVYDKYTEYATVDSWKKRYIEAEEKKIFEKSTVVFAASVPLLQYCKSFNPSSHLIRNGVDEIFCSSNAEYIEIPDELSSIPHPRIGYVGSIFDKLDFSLLLNIARSRKSYSFIFIGPVHLISDQKKKEFEELRALSNTFFIGPIEMRQLPQYYKGLDLCIGPYDRSFNQVNWINVLKAWEVIAAGKVFVCSIDRFDDPEIRKLTFIPGSDEEFVQTIDSILNNDLSEQIQEGIRLARLNTWPIRVAGMEELIEKYWVRRN